MQPSRTHLQVFWSRVLLMMVLWAMPTYVTTSNHPSTSGSADSTLPAFALSPTTNHRSRHVAIFRMVGGQPMASATTHIHQTSKRASGQHLGPSCADLIALRRAEQLKRREHNEATRQQAKSATANEQEVVDDACFVSRFNRGPARRHLGPTLQEIETQRKQKAAEHIDVAAEQLGESDVEAPTQVQIRALQDHNINIPSTKTEAAALLRQVGELRLGNELSRPATGTQRRGGVRHLQAEREPAIDIDPMAEDFAGVRSIKGGPSHNHLHFALDGISSIRRSGVISAISKTEL